MTGQLNYLIAIPDWLYDNTFGSWKRKKNQNPKAQIFKGINTNKM
jgi:hypothetical protein